MRFGRAGLLALALLLTGPLASAAASWPNVVERAERALRGKDVPLRRNAAARLVELPRGAATRLSLALLADADPVVRVAAARAATVFENAAAAPQLLPWLSESESTLRLVAAEFYAHVPFAAAIPALGRLLADPDPALRARAATALGASADASAVLPLIGRIDDVDATVRIAVARALGRLRQPSAVTALAGRAQDARSDVRREVLAALAELRDVRAIPTLALALRDPEADVRASAAVALLALPGADLEALQTYLRGEQEPSSRRRVFGALAARTDSAALELLVAQLAAPSPEERQPAHAALRAAGSPARPSLRHCVRTQPRGAQLQGCAEALAAVGTEADGAVLVAALRERRLDEFVALRALAALGGEDALVPALERLGASDPRVRAAAIETARAALDPARPDGRAVEPISAALAKAKNVSERIALVELLGRTAAPRTGLALHALLALGGPAPFVAAVAEAIGRVGGADGRLLPLLDDERGTIRLAAAVALSRRSPATLVRPLLQRLRERAAQDPFALALALGGAVRSSRDPGLPLEVLREAQLRDGALRDALLDSLQGASAIEPQLIAALLPSPAAADRAKLATLLDGSRTAAANAALLKLVADPAPRVRANAAAAWGARGAVPALARLFEDAYPEVRVAAMPSVPASRVCAALSDVTPLVRVAAAVRVLGERLPCSDGATRLLERDPAPLVRALVAKALRRRELGVEQLARCRRDEREPSVAEQCATPVPRRLPGVESVTVLVVPDGGTTPLPNAPFALEFADGSLGAGWTDRRGAVLVPRAPRGVLQLLAPSGLE